MQTVSLSGYERASTVCSVPGRIIASLWPKFTVRSGGESLGVMEPSKRSFAARGTTTTEAALMSRGASQLYLSLGDANDDGSIAIRVYKPMVLLIWLGAVVMVLGGALSLSDRRLRVGAPKPW